MKILSFISTKGGTGKTSSVQNIGVVLASRGFRVLLADLDSQANLSMCFGMNKYNSVTITSLLLGEHTFEQVKVSSQGIDLLPAGIRNGTDEARFGETKEGLALLNNELLKHEADYDYILIDCPNNFGHLTVNALLASDQFIIPTNPEHFALEGVETLMNKSKSIQAYNDALRCGGIFLTKYSPSYRKSLHKYVYEKLQAKYAGLVMETMIRDNVSIAEAQINKQNVIEYDPKSNGAKDYTSLTEELLTRAADRRLNGK